MTFENNDELYECSPMTKEKKKKLSNVLVQKNWHSMQKNKNLNKLQFMDDM